MCLMLIYDGCERYTGTGRFAAHVVLAFVAAGLRCQSALLLYLRGWRLARTTRERELPAWRAACFVAGLIALWIALASPIDALDDYLLAAHMIQHFILCRLRRR